MSLDRKRVVDLLNRWVPWALLIVVAAFAYQRFVPSTDFSKDLGPAPEISGTDLEGNPVNLSDLRGQVVVVNFWATWCPPCIAEVPGFVDIQRDMAASGVRFVGVSLDQDGPDVVKAFVKKHDINYPVTIDDGRIARAYGGIETVPTTFLVDREGRIRSRHEGILLEPLLRRSLKALLRQ